jgi:RHS repeat-associated protein
VVDGAGEVLDDRTWTPFGVEEGTAQGGLGYTGEWWDAEVSLLYLRARWYDPTAGRFMTEDPWEGNLIQPQTLQGFSYVMGNPIRYIDPSGRVYITFDDGPQVQYDEKILDTLKTSNARATFFFIGSRIDLNDVDVIEIVWRVAVEGHRLGNHSYGHYVGEDTNMTNMCWNDVLAYLGGTETQIRSALQKVKQEQTYRYLVLPGDVRDYVDRVIADGTGLFRAPGGDITPAQIELLECWDGVQGVCPAGLENPYNVYKWNVDSRDWAVSQAYEEGDLTYEEATEMLTSRLQEGWSKYGVIGDLFRNVRSSPAGSFGVRSNTDNILLHSTSYITSEVLDKFLDWIKSKGYTFDLLNPAWAN